MKLGVSSSPTPWRSSDHGKHGNNGHWKPQVPFSWVPMNTLCTFPYPRALCFLLSGVWGLFASSLFALISHLMIVLHIILSLYNLARVIVFTDKTFVVGACSLLWAQKNMEQPPTDACHPPPRQEKCPFKTRISKINDNNKICFHYIMAVPCSWHRMRWF